MKEKYKKTYTVLKTILKIPFKLWYNPKIIGANNIPQKGALIVCANHKHIMDQCPILISTKRMVHYMAKKEYFDGKFAWFFKVSGCIPVNRSIKDTEAKERALKLLKEGYAVGLFPEGTRNKTDEVLLPFKYGAVSMAKKTDAYILPVGISGEYKFRSDNLIVKIGKPFKINNMELEEANNLLKDKILELIENK
ncbi:MAG: 1-acyl-sn-glycerol-3-phosphate acyltransferase [Bacilli bacterium]|nr:1-acyl-sn-glycerol-3-phosphate acyltransferase [Bacilli bacterium]